MATLLASTITGNLTVTSGNVAVSNSALSNTLTMVVTAVAAIAQSGMAITSNTTLSTDSNLSITLNESGRYVIDGLFGVYGTTNAAGGFKLDLNGGTATINNIFWTAIAGTGLANTANSANTNTAGLLATTAQVYTITSITPSAVDYVMVKGFITTNSAGTIIPRWAQAVSAANAINRNSQLLLHAHKDWLIDRLRAFMDGLKISPAI